MTIKDRIKPMRYIKNNRTDYRPTTLGGLADALGLCSCVVKYVHLYIVSTNFDIIHDVANSMYNSLEYYYDILAEQAIIFEEKVKPLCNTGNFDCDYERLDYLQAVYILNDVICDIEDMLNAFPFENYPRGVESKMGDMSAELADYNYKLLSLI